MKFLLVSLLISFSYFNSQLESLDCDDLKFSIEVTHTSNGQDNGIINVTIVKSETKAKAFLYGKLKSNNKLGVNPTELTGLKSGKYILVLQNKECSSVKRDIIIK